MELINQTAVPARIDVSELGSDGQRGGIITAKATFRFSPGKTVLDTQSPIGLSLQPVSTELGLLPADLPLLAADDRFEVVVLGCAYAPGGQPVQEMRVALTVGDVRRELVVVGDRTWVARDGVSSMTDPVPFTRMPLTWERAYGGKCLIEVDEGAFVEVADQVNPHGRGFDAEREAHMFADVLKPPLGFPRHQYQRLLPNIERPDERIRSPEDTPPPAAWSARPIRCGLRGEHLLQLPKERMLDPKEAGRLRSVLASLRSAASEWTIDRPPENARIELEGLTPEGPVAFAVPSLRVHADYVVADRRGSLLLHPQQLLLLTDEKRLVVTYRTVFRFFYVADEVRSVRIRLAN